MFEKYDSVRSVGVDRVTRVADGIVVDLDTLLELVDHGCAPELAVRIVAPLDWMVASPKRSHPAA